jgi:maleamate amidohydrolase
MSDLDDDYAGAGFGRRLEPGARPALILIDFVRAYFEPGAEL